MVVSQEGMYLRKDERAVYMKCLHRFGSCMFHESFTSNCLCYHERTYEEQTEYSLLHYIYVCLHENKNYVLASKLIPALVRVSS